MGVITAKQLKQRTGEIIERVRAGERMTLTYRGKPVATIEPAQAPDAAGQPHARGPAQVWCEIEQTLAASRPEFSDWREAMQWARGRR